MQFCGNGLPELFMPKREMHMVINYRQGKVPLRSMRRTAVLRGNKKFAAGAAANRFEKKRFSCTGMMIELLWSTYRYVPVRV